MRKFLLILTVIILSISIKPVKALEKASDMLKKNVVTSGDGLYVDSTIDGRYVYKGANPNNYIKLDNVLYRIISVEKDGTIKVIKQGSIGDMVWDEMNARQSTNSADFCYSSSFYNGCKSWGSNTTTLDSNGNKTTQMPWEVNGTLKNLPDKEATLNTYLNNEFYNGLNDDVKSLVVEGIWNVGPATLNQTNLSESIKEESAYKWKGKVALMSVTDYVKASTNNACTSVKDYTSSGSSSSCYNNSKSHNYLYSNNYPWLISPSASLRADEVLRFYSSSLGSGYTQNDACVRPVFYLSSEIKLNGKGTNEAPYILVTTNNDNDKKNTQNNNFFKLVDVIKKKVVEAGDGLYKDKYQDGRYVYKGGNPNNFIKFNNELWRIMAIEKDGAIKIIRNNALNAPFIFEFPSNDRGTYCKSGPQFYHKERYECNAWGKLDNFDNGSLSNGNGNYVHLGGNVTEDTYLNKYLNNEYLSIMSDDAKYKIVDHDFGVGGVVDAYISYGTPDVTAKTAIENENKYKWKGKVGLGTASDILNSSSVAECESMGKSRHYYYCFETNYLLPSSEYKYTDYNYLLMTPVYNSRNLVFGASMSGLYSQDVHSYDDAYGYSYYIRPVVYLNSDVELVSGDGSKENSYILKADKNETNNKTNLPTQVVDVPSTSSFVSAIIIGGALILLIISLGVYIKVFRKKSIK